MEQSVPSDDPYYDPEFPIESDDESDSEPLGGWNPPGNDVSKQEKRDHPIPPAPVYKEANLHPTEPDPECDPEWPLACYWPVYVSNFRLDNFDEEARNAQIANFFAAKGFLTRMIFIREPERCDYFMKFQRPTMLVDMLVYFTSMEDAQWAIRLCHRQTYYGHRLNVWPGRFPVYFDEFRSIRFQMSKTYCAEKSESVVELILRNKGHVIDTVVRTSIADVIVEFGTEESMRNAVRATERWIPYEIPEFTRKQRYLEQDVQVELMQTIRDKIGFLAMTPPHETLEALMHGTVPEVDRSWENMNKPKPPPKATLATLAAKRKRSNNDLKQRMLQGRKRPAEPEPGNALLDGEPAPKSLTSRQIRGMARERANRILNTWTRADTMDKRLFKLSVKYLDARDALLSDVRKQFLNSKIRKDKVEGFYKLLDLEYQMMEKIPLSGGGLDCPQLELGLAKACLVAGEPLPFPQPAESVTIPTEYEDAIPTGHRLDPTLGPPPTMIPTVRPYCCADLNPTTLDLRCDLNWPLANLWPIYVSNFRVNVLEGELRDQQVRNYFATKGLLVTCVYVPLDLKVGTTMLVDMLVYFTSQEDAAKAIELCHRERYYGHMLNVFPGREPVFFDVTGGKTISVVAKRRDELDVCLECFQRDIIRPEVLVSCNLFEGFVACFEYPDPKEAEPAIVNLLKRSYNSAIELKEPRRKQRFLESDKREDILRKVVRDGKPRPELLQALYAGSVPSEMLNWNWRGWARARSWPSKDFRVEKSNLITRINNVLKIWNRMQRIPLD